MARKQENLEYITHENDAWILHKGNPRDPRTTRVDVSMAVKLGIRIGSRNYEAITIEQL